MTTSERFWENANLKELGNHWNYNTKLSYDIENIIPYIGGCKTLSDIACGEAKVSKILNQIFNFDKVFLFDINKESLFESLLTSPLNFSGESGNLNEKIPQEVIDSDVVLWLGGINYIIDNKRVEEILSNIKSIVIRATCTIDELYINKYSEEFKTNYESKYRNVTSILKFLENNFKTNTFKKIYPDYLESKYGSITYLFYANK